MFINEGYGFEACIGEWFRDSAVKRVTIDDTSFENKTEDFRYFIDLLLNDSSERLNIRVHPGMLNLGA